MRLRYWLVGAVKLLGMVVGASAFYCLVMWLQMDDGELTFLLIGLPLYFILFGAFMMLGLTVSLYKSMVNMALSFGSTRREVLAGLQLYRLLPSLAVTALAALLTVIPGAEHMFSPGETISICLGVFLLCSAYGSVLGMVNYRFGKVGAIVSGIGIAAVAIGAGVVFALTADDARWLNLLLDSGALTWVFLAVCSAIYLLVLLPEHRIIRSYQVRQ